MIDRELYRERNKKDFEQEWMEKNRGAIFHQLNKNNNGASSLLMSEDDKEDYRQHWRDVKMARENPQKYCADRCLATGNCDAYGNFFHLSPQEVMAFCSDCVLAEDGECLIPDAIYDADQWKP